MKPIVLKPRVWRKLRVELHKEHPKSVFMLRERMKDKLGFTVREHRAYVPGNGQKDELGFTNFGYYDEQIHLDFYSEHKRTMFLLKWSEFINGSEDGTR